MKYLVIVNPDDLVDVYDEAGGDWEWLVHGKSIVSINRWLSRQGAECLAFMYAVEYVVSIWRT